eukprot:1161865-Pelagomonas_calceolata.AAC.19
MDPCLQKFAGLLYDVAVGGVPLKEAAMSTAQSSGIDLEKVRILAMPCLHCSNKTWGHRISGHVHAAATAGGHSGVKTWQLEKPATDLLPCVQCSNRVGGCRRRPPFKQAGLLAWDERKCA